jgi:mRNA interferase HigB
MEGALGPDLRNQAIQSQLAKRLHMISQFANIDLVNVISQRGLKLLLRGKSEDVAKETMAWYRSARASRWLNLDDVRAQYPSADQVGRVLIFNVRNNRYRLIVRAEFDIQKLYVKALLTHKEYDRKEWKRWL